MPSTTSDSKSEPTCKGCEHYGKAFCKLYGSIINFDNPVTCCHKRKGAK